MAGGTYFSLALLHIAFLTLSTHPTLHFSVTSLVIPHRESRIQDMAETRSCYVLDPDGDVLLVVKGSLEEMGKEMEAEGIA